MNKDNHSLLDSFNYAIEGIITAIKSERNMRIHLFATIVVMIAVLFLKIDTFNFAILSFSISLVWITELLNSAIEKTVDLTIGKSFHPLAKKAKDIAAGAVLVAAINAIIIAYLVFDNHTKSNGKKLINLVKINSSHIGIISLVLVAILVVTIKVYFNKGTPLQGGMPSGHSALAFSASTLIISSTNSIGISILTIFIALLVAQSRVKEGVHTFLEVFIGGILGFVVTSLVVLFFHGN